MTVSSESKNFFSKLSKVWQNFKDYTYLDGINLSPEQIDIIEQDSDQLLIEGYAGTGKSLTLLYKLINVLVQQEGKRVLYVTFNKTLIDDTKKRLYSSQEYMDNKSKHFIRIATFHEIASEVLRENRVIEGGISKLTAEVVKRYRGDTYRRIAGILSDYKEINKAGYKELEKEERLYKTHDENFVVDEVNWIKAMGFIKKEKYLEIERTGRSKSIRLTRTQRNTIFKIFEDYQHQLKTKFHNFLDLEDYALKIIENKFLINEDKKFDYIFVDEVQDLDPMQIYALCSLTRKSIVLSGDAKQRIYKKSPIKYEDIGLNIKGNGKRRILNKNYRSTAEIVKLANDLVFFDNEEKLEEKQFVRVGERPIIHFSDNKKSVEYICRIINKIHAEDDSKTIAIIHREEIKPKVSNKSEFRAAMERQLLTSSFTDINTYGKKFEYKQKRQIFYTNAYDIKGLEFDTVFIVDFNRKFYPNKDEIEKIKTDNDGKDQSLVNEDIADFINREKKLLYVAMTRAKDNMYLIANTKNEERGISNFIFDFNPKNYTADNFTKKKMDELSIKNIFQLKELLGDKYTKIYEPEKYEEEKKKAKEEVIKNKEQLLENQAEKYTEIHETESCEEKEEVIIKEQLLLDVGNKPLINQKKVEFINDEIRQQIGFKDTDFKEDEIRTSVVDYKESKSVEKHEVKEVKDINIQIDTITNIKDGESAYIAYCKQELRKYLLKDNWTFNDTNGCITIYNNIFKSEFSKRDPSLASKIKFQIWMKRPENEKTSLQIEIAGGGLEYKTLKLELGNALKKRITSTEVIKVANNNVGVVLTLNMKAVGIKDKYMDTIENIKVNKGIIEESTKIFAEYIDMNMIEKWIENDVARIVEENLKANKPIAKDSNSINEVNKIIESKIIIKNIPKANRNIIIKPIINSDDEVINEFKRKGIEVIDKRARGGVLWVVGGFELTDIMKSIAMKGMKFIFLKNGGRASKHKPAWYLSNNK